MNRPLRSFGSNQVDFGGMSFPASATEKSSVIEVGYMANATEQSSSQRLTSSSMPPDSADKVDPAVCFRISDA